EMLAQHPEQRGVGRRVDGVHASVDVELGHAATPPRKEVSSMVPVEAAWQRGDHETVSIAELQALQSARFVQGRQPMKLCLHIGYCSAEVKVPVELVQTAEAVGYDTVWTAEAYGSDAVTPLAYLAGKTSRIKLGTAIMQLAARTPANAAMSAATVDALAG